MNGAKIKKAAADRSDVNGAFDNVANKATLTYGQHIQLHSLHDIGFSFTKKKKMAVLGALGIQINVRIPFMPFI